MASWNATEPVPSCPHVAVIAGPNGAGKSTCGPAVLQQHLYISEFVNADIIAAGLSVFHPENSAVEAGRIMLGRLRNLAERNVSFAFETTLASRSFAPWIDRLKKQGYQCILVYISGCILPIWLSKGLPRGSASEATPYRKKLSEEGIQIPF